MNAERALAILGGEVEGVAYAMTWVPTPALRALTWEAGIENEPEALASVAAAFSLDLVFVPAAEEWAAEATARLAEDGVASAWAVAGPMGRVADTLGWLPALRATAAAPGELAARLDEALHESLEEIRAAAASGADAVVCADDLAGASGWLVAPDFALEALVPCYRRMVSAWGGRGPAIFHSDGDVRALMPALSAAGFSAIHLGGTGTGGLRSLVLAAHAAGLCPVGGVGSQSLHLNGAGKTGRETAWLASLGRLAVSDDGGLVSAADLAAYGAALDAVREVLGAS